MTGALLNGTVGQALGILGVTFVLVALGLGAMALILGSGRARKIGVLLSAIGVIGLIGVIVTNTTPTTTIFGIIDWSQIALVDAAAQIGAALGGGGVALGLFMLMMAKGR